MRGFEIIAFIQPAELDINWWSWIKVIISHSRIYVIRQLVKRKFNKQKLVEQIQTRKLKSFDHKKVLAEKKLKFLVKENFWI